VELLGVAAAVMMVVRVVLVGRVVLLAVEVVVEGAVIPQEATVLLVQMVAVMCGTSKGD
jgi:hypothetical protein